MPTDLIRFPGDLITADLWNRMLALVDGINARLDAQQALVVPDVVGDLFPSARDEIVRARLDLNTVFDVEGTKADPDDPAMASRTVVAQTPGPNESVANGTRMTLLITALKVPKTGAPTIATAGVPGGGNAQVGQPLDLTGTNFTNARVIIRGTELLSTQFQAPDATHIHIPKVPPFEGSPTPGTSKDIPVTVRNNAGEGSIVVKFFEAAIPIPSPSISTVQMFDATRLRVMGQNLVQSGQPTSVTIGGQPVSTLTAGDGALIIPMPAIMATAFSQLPPAHFNLIKNLDTREVFLVTINDFNNSSVAQPAAAQAIAAERAAQPATARIPLGTEEGPLALGTAGIAEGLSLFRTTMKLFLRMPLPTATNAQTATRQISGNTVSLIAQGQTVLSVNVTGLQNFPVVVTVGDKSTTFPVKFGAIPDIPINPNLGSQVVLGRFNLA